MPATMALPNTPTTSPTSTAAGAVQIGQGTSRSGGGEESGGSGAAGGTDGGGVTRGGGTLDMASQTLGRRSPGSGRELGQARDRPHAGNGRAVSAVDQDRLDPSGARPGDVLVKRVADV